MPLELISNSAAVNSKTKGLVLGGALIGALLFQAYRFAPDRPAAQVAPDALPRAVAAGDPVLVERAMAQNADVNAVGPDGRTALIVATQQGDRELIERLLQSGANVDAAGPNGVTAVMIAATRGDLDLLRALISRSSKLEALDAAGNSAVHQAIAAGQFEAAEMLVPRVATMQATGADGRDLVAMACDSGSARLLAGVLTHSSDSLEWTPRTRGALQAALAGSDRELTRLLLAKHAAAPTVEGRAIPLLAQAIATDDRPLFDALLAAGADPNTTLPAGADKEFLTLLGSNYIRDYVKGDDGITVLMLASAFAKPEYVRALLDAHAAKNRLTARFKMMALYFAARLGF